MKKKSLFLIALAVVLLSGGLFAIVADAVTNDSIVQTGQNFSARTHVTSGRTFSGLRAQIENTNTGVRSNPTIREGTNLQGHATSPTVHMQLGHWARGIHHHRVPNIVPWIQSSYTHQMRSR